MAKVWYLVIVLIFIQNVFASKYKTCDECVRHGNNWCSYGKKDHCPATETDTWCEEGPELLKIIENKEVQGDILSFTEAQRTVYINNDDSLPFYYHSTVERKVSTQVVNTTQHKAIKTTQHFDEIVSVTEQESGGGQYKLNIEMKVPSDFCSDTSTDEEFIFVRVKVENVSETALIKYHVACACECSKKVEKKSPTCNGHGDFSCGVCQCYDGWSGEDCMKSEEQDCGTDRGDITDQCIHPLKNEVKCSGNGICDGCGRCSCFRDREGSQYFDTNYYCSDICQQTSACGRCIANGTLGVCTDSECVDENTGHRLNLNLKAYNATVAEEREDDMKVWVRCTETFPVGSNQNCHVEYLAMRTEVGYQVMLLESCNDSTQDKVVIGGGGTKVPIILGVLGIIAAVAAVGGVMLWKHFGAEAPMPMSSSDYQNIDAEDCVGENPLYKSPTTTFTNPQFGKC